METMILYENGDYWVKKEIFGKTSGYAVYKNGLTHSVRVASIGYEGVKGFERAKAEVDKRAQK